MCDVFCIFFFASAKVEELFGICLQRFLDDMIQELFRGFDENIIDNDT